jgi:hypothetical protein
MLYIVTLPASNLGLFIRAVRVSCEYIACYVFINHTRTVSRGVNSKTAMWHYTQNHSIQLVITYSWFSYVENICKFDNIDINIIQDNNNSRKNYPFNKDIKQQLKQKYEELFFDKLKSQVLVDRTLPPFSWTSIFFSCKQHFATFYVSLDDIYTIN